MPQIPHSELTDLEAIGQGGYGTVYRAKHARFGTVVYKELNTRVLGDRYGKAFLVDFSITAFSSITEFNLSSLEI